MKGTKSPLPDRLSFLLMLGTVAFSPILAGGVTPAGRAIIAIGGSIAGILSLATRNTSAPRGAIPILSTFLIFPLIGILQLVPVPDDLLRTLSPAADAAYESTNLIFSRAGEPMLYGSLSVNREATTSAVLLLIGVAGLAVAAARTVTSSRRRSILLNVLVISVFAETTLGIIRDGFSRPLRGTFIVANHFATCVAMVVALAGAQLFLRRAKRGLHVPAIAMLPIVAILGAILVGTFSRGAVAALAAAAALYAFPRARMKARDRMAIVAGLVLLALLMSLTFLGGQLQSESVRARIEIWRMGLRTAAAFPLAGSGLGAYGDAVQSSHDIQESTLVQHAHNGLLQIFMTAGAPGLVTLVVLAILLGRALLTRAGAGESTAWATGALLAAWTFGLHSMVEFSASIPAVLAILAVITGSAFSSVSIRTPEAAAPVRSS